MIVMSWRVSIRSISGSLGRGGGAGGGGATDGAVGGSGGEAGRAEASPMNWVMAASTSVSGPSFTAGLPPSQQAHTAPFRETKKVSPSSLTDRRPAKAGRAHSHFTKQLIYKIPTPTRK